MRREVRLHGETVSWKTVDGTWLVPRHYIVLHGIRPWELKAVATQYGWMKIA